MNEQAEFTYHVFISYSYVDRDWVQMELLQHLESKGLQVCIDFRDFIPGAARVTEIEKALQTSRKTLLVLTPAYLNDVWAQFEQLVLQTLDPANQQLRLVPLLKAECDLPPRLGYLTRIDFVNPEREEIAWTNLLAALGVPTGGERREDWGEAIAVDVFYGRQTEIAELESWIVDDRCRLIAILGMGGIGKSSLTARLVEQTKEQFDYLFWRDLRNAPPIEFILGDCIKFLSDQQQTDLPESIDSRISLLLNYFREQRCLLILDNAESILQIGERVGHYRKGHKDYGKLIQLVGSTSHQSCLVITSREKPQEIAPLEGKTSPVRSMQLVGLDKAASRELLEDKDLLGTDQAWSDLINLYGGNPLALRLVSATIEDWFERDIITFLQDELAVFGDIEYLIEQQWKRLPETRKEVMYWLAIAREMVSLSTLQQEIAYWLVIEREMALLSTLQEDIVRPISREELLETIESLRRRSLIEKSNSHFILQPVVMEYLTKQFVKRIFTEIATGTLRLFRSHALIQAQAKDYVMQSQIRFILRPVADRLLATWGQRTVEDKLNDILASERQESQLTSGYVGGNTLNLLIQLGSNLSGYDFSRLTVWQANLKATDLHDTNFAYSNLSKCAFAETFGMILSVAYSPDGRLIAAGTASGNVIVWQVAENRQFLILTGHTYWVRSVAFSPDGSTMATGSGDCTVRLWNVETGQCKVLEGHTDWVRSVAFNLDGSTLVSGASDQTVRLWTVETGELLKTLQGHTDWVWSVAFSPTENVLASGSNDNTVRIWDADTGESLMVLRGHTDWVKSVAFYRDGSMLASGSEDQTVRLWDVKTGELLKILRGHTDRVWSVAFSPNGDMLASSSYDLAIRLWSVDTGRPIKTLQGHDGFVISVAFSPDGNALASGSEDQSMRVWDTRTGQCLKTFQGYTNRVQSVAFVPNSRLLASGSTDQIVRLWDVNTGQCLTTFYGHTNRVQSVAISPDGRTLASCGDDQTVRLWDINSKQLSRVLRGHTSFVISVAFSPDGCMLASSCDDLTVRLWDVETGQCIRIMRGHTSWIASVAFSPDGLLLASGSADKMIRIWNVETGECIKLLQGHNLRVDSVIFSPEDYMLASGSDDQSIRLWDINTRNCLNILEGHTSLIKSVAFSPDGQILASGSDDKTVKLWDVSTGKCHKTLEGHTHLVWSVAFSPDGQLVVSGSDDETIKVWNVYTGECLKAMKSKKIYEGMIITGVTGLTDVQKANLKALGAVADVDD